MSPIFSTTICSAARRLCVGLLLTGALSVATVSARATTLLGVDTAVAPGGTADVVFNFDFGQTPISVASLDLSLSYDNSVPLTFDNSGEPVFPTGMYQGRLALTGVSATYQGQPIGDLQGTLQGPGWSSPSLPTPGTYAFNWIEFDTNHNVPLPPLAVSGKGSLTFAFQAAGLGVGQQSEIDLVAHYYLDPTFDPTPTLSATAFVTATAVPESSTWVTMVAGLVLVGAIARRKVSPGA